MKGPYLRHAGKLTFSEFARRIAPQHAMEAARLLFVGPKYQPPPESQMARRILHFGVMILYASGWTPGDIADTLGMSKAAVQYILRKSWLGKDDTAWFAARTLAKTLATVPVDDAVKGVVKILREGDQDEKSPDQMPQDSGSPGDPEPETEGDGRGVGVLEAGGGGEALPSGEDAATEIMPDVLEPFETF